MIDFKKTAKEIFDICTNIAKSDGRATEKIEEILKQVYEDGMLKNEKLKRELKAMRGAANSSKLEVNRLNLKIKELYREMARIAKYTVAESSHDKNDPRDRV